MENKKKALGRGLEQLFNNENLDVETIERQIYDSASSEEIIEVNLDELRPNPYQPRKTFKEEAFTVAVSGGSSGELVGAAVIVSVVSNSGLSVIVASCNSAPVEEFLGKNTPFLPK